MTNNNDIEFVVKMNHPFTGANLYRLTGHDQMTHWFNPDAVWWYKTSWHSYQNDPGYTEFRTTDLSEAIIFIIEAYCKHAQIKDAEPWLALI